ncbi:hypothetical protein CF327_g7123 [Tilletia walkeri]|uniref:Uncharacterized protein n=1 Tax=Tilletia walkeri TaxID=117179 RepID=A0A8X7T1G8_9BASI|nr:hypothetical protein CF327_g7123 [Tilletia walkeri]KAE8261624.1 hypothetical protein A4X09_0g7633 [Tilletia walkeri]
MARFHMLIALLPFLVSTTFALPLGGTSLGRSSTALQPGHTITQPNSREVYITLPAVTRARLLTRGDELPLKEAKAANEWMAQALDLAKGPNRNEEHVANFLQKTLTQVQKVEAALEAARPKHIWPKEGERLNTEITGAETSTSTNKEPWP